jgi:uridine kinase
MSRAALLAAVAPLVPAAVDGDCVRVGVDGADGAGKTTFANELATRLRADGRHVIRISVDDFHRPRAERYRRGRDSAEGFWLDSFDHPRLWQDVLHPLGPSGSRRYRTAAHDLVTDQPLEPPAATAPPGSVVIVDGLFLHRDELVAAWELSILLDVPADVRVRRMAVRDGSPADPAHPSLRRYLDAQRIYAEACAPLRRADVVVDNTDLDRPHLVRAGASQQ